jgi:hypothetical protein
MSLQDTTSPTTLSTESPTALQPKKAQGKDAADQQKVSEGVESMFVRQMLEASHMFDGVGGHPMMQGMMLEKLADSVVKGGHLGIGDMVAGGGAAAVKSPPRSVHGPLGGLAGAAGAAGAADVDSLGSADELMLLRPRQADAFALDMGFDWSIDMGAMALPDDLLPKAAQEAIDDGRVDGLGRGASVQAALQRSWRPVIGEPIGATGVVPLAQASSNAVLGEGPKTIRQVGCLLTSMAMVSNTLTGQRRGVDEANDVVTAGGGFKGLNMQFGPASKALGVRTVERGAFTGDTTAIDTALAKGHPVVVGVDFKQGASSSVGGTDHFLVVTGRTAEGSYTGIDSGNGKPLEFQPDGAGALRAGRYRLSEFVTLEPDTAASSSTVAQRTPAMPVTRWGRFGG